jgi:exopolysaccharide biosynthesis WecB/TagA/CpsF family protein
MKCRLRQFREGYGVAVGLTMGVLNEPVPLRRDILGIGIMDLSRDEAIALLQEAMDGARHLKVAFCNAHTANMACDDPGFRAALGTFAVFPDGVGIDLAARWLTGAVFRANLNGTDFVPHLLASAPRPLRIGLIGGRPGVAERAASVLAGLGPGHAIVATLDGYSAPAVESAWLDQLVAEPLDLLLVAMGNPRQELWIASHVTGRHASVAIGVGALLDFLAGEVTRAPALVRKLRLEWTWRLMLEPRRLFKRYVLGNPLFLLRILAARMRLGRG